MTHGDTAAPVKPASAHRPSARDYQYLAALKLWLTLPPHQQTRTKLAELAGLSRTGLYAFESNARRMAWMREQLGGARRDDQWEHILDKAYWRALGGDVGCMVFFAKAIGKFTGTGEPVGAPQPGGPGGTTVVALYTHIPRPELPPATADLKPVIGGSHTSLIERDVLDLTRR